MAKDDLTSLPNIGKVLAARLSEVDINTPQELMAAGTENVFLRLRAVDEGACINELYAIEGAIRGIRWHALDLQRKVELRAFFNMISRQ